MFNKELNAKIRSITTKVRDDDGELERTDHLSLQIELDEDICKAWRPEAAQVLDFFSRGYQTSGGYSLGSEEVEVHASDGADGVMVAAQALSVAIKRPTKEGSSPTARIRLAFTLDDDMHAWFNNRLEELVNVSLVREQTTMEGV